MPDPHGYIYSKQIIGALDPYLCIRCTERMPQPGINKICEFCELYLTIDSPWKFLHDKVLELYKFFVAVQRKSLSAQFYFDQPRTDKGIETQLWFEDGIPGIRAQLPVVEKMYWIDEVTKEQKSMTLDGMQQELLEQVLLSQAQCHIAMLMMPDVIGQELERDGKEYIKEVREIPFRPKHPGFTWHWTYRVFMHDGRSFAVNLTDRQLGWLRLVQPWEDYAKLGHGIEDDDGTELGTKAKDIKECNDWQERYQSSSESEDSDSDASRRSESSYERYKRKDEARGIPSWDVITQEAPDGWAPKVGDKEAEYATLMHKIDLGEFMCLYLEMWREGKWE